MQFNLNKRQTFRAKIHREIVEWQFWAIGQYVQQGKKRVEKLKFLKTKVIKVAVHKSARTFSSVLRAKFSFFIT